MRIAYWTNRGVIYHKRAWARCQTSATQRREEDLAKVCISAETKVHSVNSLRGPHS